MARGSAKVAASTGGRSFCSELGLPDVPAEFRPPFIVADTRFQPRSRTGTKARCSTPTGSNNGCSGPSGTAPEQRHDRNAGVTRMRGTFIKFGIFAVVMIVLTAFLFATFAEVRTGSGQRLLRDLQGRFAAEDRRHRAVAGIRGGHRAGRALDANRNVLVKFDAGSDIKLTDGTKAQIKYLNLVGDRYLELVDAPGSTKILPAGRSDPHRSHSAGTGPRPAARRAEARDPGAQSAGRQRAARRRCCRSCRARAAPSNRCSPGRRRSRIAGGQQPGGRATHRRAQDRRTKTPCPRTAISSPATIDKLEELVRGLSRTGTRIGEAITALDNGTASVSDLLGQARTAAGRHGRSGQRARGASVWRQGHLRRRRAERLPDIYRKLAPGGLYGAFFPYYICGIAFRGKRSRGPHRSVPWIRQETGRCRDE